MKARVQQGEDGPQNDILILESEGVWVAEEETDKKKNGEAEVKPEEMQLKHGHFI